MPLRLWIVVAVLSAAAFGPHAVAAQATPIASPAAVLSAPVSGYRVIAEYPHDPGAFTQGLVFIDDVLFEGTGLNGASTLRRVDLESGEVRDGVALPRRFFGEGIAVLDDRIYQLTWQNGVAIVFDRESFEPVDTFQYETEGWGLTTDGERLIMSDGSDTLFFRDPATFDVLDTVAVREGDAPVTRLNELEYVDGQIWANVWQTDLIARIDPATGEVVGWIDLTGILPDAERPESPDAVLNGIAYDAESGRLFVTGKLWPALFEIEIVE